MGSEESIYSQNPTLSQFFFLNKDLYMSVLMVGYDQRKDPQTFADLFFHIRYSALIGSSCVTEISCLFVGNTPSSIV